MDALPIWGDIRRLCSSHRSFNPLPLLIACRSPTSWIKSNAKAPVCHRVRIGIPNRHCLCKASEPQWYFGCRVAQDASVSAERDRVPPER